MARGVRPKRCELRNILAKELPVDSYLMFSKLDRHQELINELMEAYNMKDNERLHILIEQINEICCG